MFNINIYLIAYFYSPCVDSTASGIAKSNFALGLSHLTSIFDRKQEHENIMTKFYEQELPELTHNSIEDDTIDFSTEMDAVPSADLESDNKGYQ